MASLCSSPEPDSSPPTPNLNEHSRLLPDLAEEIISVMGENGTVIASEEDRRNQSLAHPTNNCGNSHCADLACETRVFQVPINASGQNKSVLESWVITYHAPETRLAGWYQWLDICWWRRIETEGAHILAVVPNVHFSQDEIATECAGDKAQYVARGRPLSGYAADLERRLRKLDWAVQDEIYDLINDRIQSSSNAFRRRDWKLVKLTKIPGGEMTDAPTGRAQHRTRSVLRKLPFCKPRIPKMPITEYRLVLRGTEAKVNNNGWASHNRYSRPWRDVDEKELGEIKLRRRDSQFVSDKFVNF